MMKAKGSNYAVYLVAYKVHASALSQN